MNLNIVRRLLARILFFFALLLFLPFSLSLFYQEALQNIFAFAGTILLTLLSAFLLTFKTEKHMKRMYTREGILICAFSWILLSFFGALPFVFSQHLPHFLDAFFEMSSGFTTTGTSLIKNIDTLPHSLVFLRALSQFVGGMGILVLVLAIFPKSSLDTSTIHALKAEMPGPVFGKLLPKTQDFSRILYIIYFAMTFVLILLYLFGGMNLFDAVVTALATAGTGGFTNHSEGLRFFHSPYIEYITSLFMVLFAINFNLFYFLLLKEWKAFYKDEEFKTFLWLIFGSVVLIMLNLAPHYENKEQLFREALFSVTSIISSTGFATADFSKWPLFSQCILLFLMFIGGCAGSTAGGLKVVRTLSLWKSLKLTILQALNSKRKMHLQINEKPVSASFMEETHRYFALYVFCFFLLLLLNSMTAKDFLSIFSLTASSFNNIGQALGNYGPTGNFADLPMWNKFLLSFTMILGRLELFPLLLLFAPRTWKKV